MKNKILLICLTAVMGFAISAQAYKTGDTQWWIDSSAGGKVEGAKVGISTSLRLGDDAKQFYYAETFFSVGYDLTDWFYAAAQFGEIYERKNKTIYKASMDDEGMLEYKEQKGYYWEQENRPRLELKFHDKIEGWGLEDRVRIEYRMKQDSDDYFRFRNRVKVKTPWKLDPFSINPYVAYELFFSDLPDDDWVVGRQRFYVGLGMKFLANLKGELFYLKQLDWKSSDWREYNVIGTALSASF